MHFLPYTENGCDKQDVTIMIVSQSLFGVEFYYSIMFLLYSKRLKNTIEQTVKIICDCNSYLRQTSTECHSEDNTALVCAGAGLISNLQTDR